MPMVNGSMKVKQLSLQGTVAEKDFSLEVNKDNFEIRRGDKTLLALGEDGNTNPISENDTEVSRTEINISVPVTFEKDVSVNGNLIVNETIPDAVLARKNTRTAMTVGASGERYPSIAYEERFENEHQNYTDHSVNGFVSEREGFKFFTSCAHGLSGDYFGEKREDFVKKGIDNLTLTNIHDTELFGNDERGFMNDCWGHEFCESVYPDGWSKDEDGWHFGPGLSSKEYALVGDNRGMSVWEMNENSDNKQITRYENDLVNAWTDIKTYTVHTLNMEGNLSNIQPGDFLEWKFPNHKYVFTFEVLSLDNVTKVMRGKSYWPILKYCIDVDVASYPGVKVKSGKLEEFAYWGKDNGSFHVIDLSTLRDKSNRRAEEVLKVPVNNIAEWPMGETTGDPNLYPWAAGHNEYVDEVTGTLYNVDDNNGTTLLDIMSNPASPKVVGKMDGQHDMATKTYSRSEQNSILGIPFDKCTDNLVLCVGAATNIYVYDVTDRANVVNFGEESIAGYSDGYTHAGWFTTDKRFFITHQENSGDNSALYYGTAFVMKIKWDTELQKIKPKWVQTYRNGVPSHGHNNYCVSNIHHSLRKKAFEDYVFHANYDAGTRVFRLRYKSTYDKFDVQDEHEPFDVKEIAYLDSGSTLGHGDLFGTWSCFPFGLGPDSAMTAGESSTSSGRCLMSGEDGFQFFGVVNSANSKYGKESDKVPDKNADGPLTLLSKGEARINVEAKKFVANTTNDKLINDNKLYINNMLDNKLDLSTTLLTETSLEEGDSIRTIKVEDLGIVKTGEMVYAETARGFIAGRVLSESETSLSKTQDNTPASFKGDPKTRTNFNRVDEIVTTLQCLPGDSGSPVFNKDGKLVGIVRDSNGSNVGVTKIFADIINNENKLITSTGVQETNIKSFKGVWNEMMAGRPINDPYSFWAPYIHPKSGKIQGYMSGSGTNYNILGFHPGDEFMDPSLKADGLPLGEGMVPNEYAFNETLSTSSATDGNKFAIGANVYPTWFWNFKPFVSFKGRGPSAVPLTSPDVTPGEYIKGTKSSDGPMLFVMDKYRLSENGPQVTYVAQGITHYLYVCYPVSKFNDPDINEGIFQDAINSGLYGGNKTNHVPESGDVMTSDSGIQVTCGYKEDGEAWSYRYGTSKVPMVAAKDFASAENPYVAERYSNMFFPTFLNSRFVNGEDVSGVMAFLPHIGPVQGGMTVRGTGDVDIISDYSDLSEENTLNLLIAAKPKGMAGSYLGVELHSEDDDFKNLVVVSQDPATLNKDNSNVVPYNKRLLKVNGSEFTSETIKNIYLSKRDVEMSLEFEGEEKVYTLMTKPYVARTIRYI